MKNYEKYAEEIKECTGGYVCDSFIKPKILKKDDCKGMGCEWCTLIQMLWLLEEYEEPEEPEEPEIDWSKVEVNAPILVRNFEDEIWVNRHFARYEDGTVCA